MKHYGSYHGVFNRILKDMGLLDAREDLSRTGVKFPRPKIERVFTAGAGNNLALELARTAAIWSGGFVSCCLRRGLWPVLGVLSGVHHRTI